MVELPINMFEAYQSNVADGEITVNDYFKSPSRRLVHSQVWKDKQYLK